MRALSRIALTHSKGFPLHSEVGLLSVSSKVTSVVKSFYVILLFQYQGHVLFVL